MLLGGVLSGAAFYWFTQRFHSLNEAWLRERNLVLKTEWETMDLQVDNLRHNLDNLISKEDNVYRVILDSQPLSAEERQAGTGGREDDDTVPSYPFILKTMEKIKRFSHQLDIETQSLTEVASIMNERKRMWESRPAIQPISNKDLTRISSLFQSRRFNPVLGIYRPHEGIDFAAPTGTPIFATGDGRVEKAWHSDTYGNVVYIDHGFGYQTRYAHMSRFIVHDGEKVKRGQVIGYVGSTGEATGPHLHYEVRYDGEPINPINFFQQDLSSKEYQKLINKTNDSIPPLENY